MPTLFPQGEAIEFIAGRAGNTDAVRPQDGQAPVFCSSPRLDPASDFAGSQFQGLSSRLGCITAIRRRRAISRVPTEAKVPLQKFFGASSRPGTIDLPAT